MNEIEQKLNIELERTGKLRRAELRKVKWSEVRLDKEKELKALRLKYHDAEIPKDFSKYNAQSDAYREALLKEYDYYYETFTGYFHGVTTADHTVKAVLELEEGRLTLVSYYLIQFIS